MDRAVHKPVDRPSIYLITDLVPYLAYRGSLVRVDDLQEKNRDLCFPLCVVSGVTLVG
jgi:hypothetical protein